MEETKKLLKALDEWDALTKKQQRERTKKFREKQIQQWERKHVRKK